MLCSFFKGLKTSNSFKSSSCVILSVFENFPLACNKCMSACYIHFPVKHLNIGSFQAQSYTFKDL